MKVTTDDRLHEIPLETQTSGDPEALFKQARQRRRRVHMAWLGVAVIVVGAIAAIVVATSSVHRSPPHQAKVTIPSGP